MRYNMRRQEEGYQQQQLNDQASEQVSEDDQFSSSCRAEELLNSEEKIDELHRSVVRLREFVASLSGLQNTTIPLCVEEYCDKIEQYRMKSVAGVLEIAERRVNKMLRNRKIKRNWNNEDIALLIWLVSKRLQLARLTHFNQLQKTDWEFISALISGSSWQKCKFRWLSLKKVKLITHKWSKQQERLLREAVGSVDKINWKLVSEKLYEKNPSRSKVFRTAKQCREHWNCFLNPTIQKGPWSLQEDRKLLEYVLQLQGSKKWSEISKFMQGRTENALKNRFNLLINRQRKDSGHLTEKRLVKICLNKLMLQEGQQQRIIELPAPIPPQIEDKSQEEESQSQVQLSRVHSQREPIIPSVIQQSASNSSSNFAFASYDQLINFLNSSVGNTMISSSQMFPQNAYYVGILFPGQFL